MSVYVQFYSLIHATQGNEIAGEVKQVSTDTDAAVVKREVEIKQEGSYRFKYRISLDLSILLTIQYIFFVFLFFICM